VGIVLLWGYLTYTYLQYPTGYVLYAFTGLPVTRDVREFLESYPEYVLSIIMNPLPSELIDTVPWLGLVVAASVGVTALVSVGLVALSDRDVPLAYVGYAVYGLAFVAASNLVIVLQSGARGLYLYQFYRLLELSLFNQARILLFLTFLVGAVLVGTITDCLD
jgi:hypothetical protein